VWLERSDARGSVFALCLPIDVRVEQVSVQRDPSPVTATA
jgi:hypothetical protein